MAHAPAAEGLHFSAFINPALDSVSTDLIRKYYRKVGDYEKAYIEGKAAGKEVENAVKVCKSHRRVFNESHESSNLYIFV